MVLTEHICVMRVMGGVHVAKKTRKQIKKDKIEQDLLDQLERNGTVGEYYTDLIADYMSLWQTKEMLYKDIDDRGVSVIYNNGGGQSGFKKNDSVDQVLKVNAQMLKILDALGIKPSTSSVGDGDEL